MTGPFSETVTGPYGPTCPRCADWSRGYAAGYPDGKADGMKEAAGLGPAHPAVVDSVTRMFPGWDGTAAARARSATRFHAWHRKEAA